MPVTGPHFPILAFQLTECGLGGGAGHAWINDRGEEGDRRHDRVSGLGEGNGLVRQWACEGKVKVTWIIRYNQNQ